MQKRAEPAFRKGTVITGKWQRKSYTIIRPIGSGMIGTVYLCRNHGKHYALKLGRHPTALVREVTILKQFNKARDQNLGPFLFDVDDVMIASGQSLPFYVMEYIEGVRLESYVKQHGPRVIGQLLQQLLERLEQIHQMGYVFGDLKNENLLVRSEGVPVLRLIDVGGVTKQGQSVKEYSNFFDRGYWQLGTRKGEPSYDLFALVMVFLTVYYPKQFKRGTYPRQQLAKAVRDVPALRAYSDSFQKALDGKYRSAKAMRQDIKTVSPGRSRRRRSGEQKEPIISQAIIMFLLSFIFWMLSFLT